MRDFFYIVFGGIFLVFVGIGISWAAGKTWQVVEPAVSSGSVMTSFNKVIRYTASEEEDLIESTIRALPGGREGRITADVYLLKNLTKDEVIAEQDSDRLLPIASITKLVTAVVARQLVPEYTKIELTPQIILTYGNTAGFRAGEIFTAGDLIYPLLMVSSNDAAEALARHFGRKNFVKSMNDFAQSIGAYRTYFADPSGLSAKNASSANDQAIILEWIAKNDPEILEITKVKSKTIRSHTWVNPAHFLSWSYYMGGKNGFTDEAGRTAATLFRLGPNKDVYAIIVLGSDNRDADMERLISKVK